LWRQKSQTWWAGFDAADAYKQKGEALLGGALTIVGKTVGF